MFKYHLLLNTLIFVFLAVVVLDGYREILSGIRFSRRQKNNK